MSARKYIVEERNGSHTRDAEDDRCWEEDGEFLPR